MRTAVVAIAIALPSAAAAQSREDVQLWAAVGASGSVSGDLVAAADVQFRLVDDLSRAGQTVVRGSLGYRVGRTVTLSLGYVRAIAHRQDGPDFREDRAFEQLGWAIGSVGGGALSTRARLEQRWAGPTRALAWRYRQQLRYARPLTTRGLAAVATVEPFFHLNSADWGPRAGLDQVRAMAGVSLPLSPALVVEAGYQLQYVRAAGGDRLNHTVPISLALRF